MTIFNYNFFMEESTRIKIFAGVSKRFFAYIVDLVILNSIFLGVFIALKILGYSYLDFWTIFLIIYLMYFTLGDSLILNGQTVGKRYLKIQLINISGRHISTGFAFLRTIFTSLIYFNYHFIFLIFEHLKVYLNDLFITILILFIESILLFGISIFLIFHPYYQGLHDVVFRTFVVAKDSYDKEKIESAFNYTRITASYFFLVILTTISILVGTILKIFWG